jgi:hypothetical protein
MAPVKLRAVASGLMIEKVRSIAIKSSFGIAKALRTARLIAVHSRVGQARAAHECRLNAAACAYSL